MKFPQTSEELLWWAFQLTFLGVMWFMKRDLGEIKADGRANRLMGEANSKDISVRNGVCEERHRRLDLEIARLQKRKDDPHE